MHKVLYLLIQVFLGLLLGSASIYLGYLFLSNLNTAPNYLFLSGSIIFMFTGVFLLFKAGKKDDIFNPVNKKMPSVLDENEPNKLGGLDKTIEKNNQLSSEWARTTEQRERLRLLELADAGDENK